MWEFIQAETDEQLAEVRTLFLEYAAWLNLSLCFQGFDQEMAGLPGRYALPDGRLWLVTDGAASAGVVALRRLDAETCEMKRLFVRPAFRGHGLGRKMVAQLLNEALALGYRRMVLDTLPDRMNEAVTLYRRLGFKEIPPYYHNPVGGTIYLGVTLQPTEPGL